jgi:hypothetical protein
MTMRDPDLQRTTTVRDRRGSNLGWLVGALVVLLLLGALALSWDSTPSDTASNTGNAGSNAANTNATAPASTTGSAATTGSGSTGPASNVPPAGTTAR